MTPVMTALKAGVSLIAGRFLVSFCNDLVDLPTDDLVKWAKSRFDDPSQALPQAIAAPNDWTCQAIWLASAGDSPLGRITGEIPSESISLTRFDSKAILTGVHR